MRRAILIFVKFTRATGHPHQKAVVNNYRGLLMEMGQSREQVLAALRVIAPDFGIAEK